MRRKFWVSTLTHGGKYRWDMGFWRCQRNTLLEGSGPETRQLRRALIIAMTDADQYLSKVPSASLVATTPLLERVTPGEFDEEAGLAIGAAFDAACKALQDRGQPPIVRDVIASRIIDAARSGERDPDRLCDYALAGIPRRD